MSMVDVCAWCEEPLSERDPNPRAPLVRMHRECFIRQIVGAVAHQERRCTCYGGTDSDDPVGMSRREAARQAAARAFADRDAHRDAARRAVPMADRSGRWSSN